ncbi:polysaccharide deacetylase family protein [Anaerovibrio sp.]|uniref:polysaccharide deacetylase family protein n=1 Tax=Anaerovibrio sp. TaxID=1872532 RepID=UPI003F16FC8F
MLLSPKQWCLILLYLFLSLLLTCFLSFAREAANGVPVLSYHQVNDTDNTPLAVPTAEFERQIAYLHDAGYHAITPDQLTGYLNNGSPLPSKPVLITFDDGYRDNYENAFPILKKYHMTATIFLVSDFMDRFDNYLTWAQVQEMSEDGICMGVHTLSHFELTGLSDSELNQQLEGGKLAVEWKTLKFAEYIAYPCGSYNDKVLEHTRQYGYKGGFTVRYDLVHAGDNPYLLSRVPIFGHNSHSFLKFQLRLHGAPLWGRLERLRALLIRTGHPAAATLIWLP